MKTESQQPRQSIGPLQSAAGFSLIEVLIAIFVIAIGLLGVAGMQSTLLKDGFDTAQRSQMIWLAQEMVSRMRVNDQGRATGYTTAAANNNLCNNGPTKMCSDYFSVLGNAKVNAAADCTANEMAEFDVWELSCGYQNPNTSTDALDNLRITGVDITCASAVAGVCNEDSNFTVTFNWTSKSVQDQLDAGRVDSDNSSADALEEQNVSLTVRL